MEPMLPANHPVLSRTLKEFHEPGVDDDWFQWLSELIVQMAEATDAPLVAEYYPLQPSSLILQDWKSYRPRLPQDWYRFQPLLKAFGYRVRLSDAGWVIIESRARDQARENDIPHPTLQRWLFKPDRRGILTLDECAEFAVLSWEQRSSLYFYIQSFAELNDLMFEVPREIDFLHGGLLHAQHTLVKLIDDRGGTVPRPEEGAVFALQLYASLKPAQRAQLRGAGIPFTQLDTAQQWRFLLAYTRGNILTMDDFWLPPAEREARAQQAYVRLVSELRTREGVRIPSDHQPPIRTIEDWKRTTVPCALRNRLCAPAYGGSSSTGAARRKPSCWSCLRNDSNEASERRVYLARQARWEPMEQAREQYVVDTEGNPVAVIVDIQFYRRLLDAWEELEAIQAYDLAKASGEQPIPLEEALRRVEEGRA
jgi:hypothetical protein